MSEPVILETRPLGMPWETADPFLFCVHHDDRYPAGNEKMGPKASLAGRNLGQDFGRKDGFSMYHGEVVPGFPSHPHRGFETVTIMRCGLIDHSDSLGATARFGAGDVQWLTAGRGIVHCEMFPLVHEDEPNPLELFQIWLNLPAEDKMVEPHFAMLWNKDIPRRSFTNDGGKKTEVQLIAGKLDDADELAPPPPHSWASRADSDVAIWSIVLEPGASWTLPAAKGGAATNRTLYFFGGTSITVGGEEIDSHCAIAVRADVPIEISAGDAAADVLLLQGRPIGQPVAAYGPFVMNTAEEIEQAMADYRRTRFGGWPWPSSDPVHPRTAGRFARHADGKLEKL